MSIHQAIQQRDVGALKAALQDGANVYHHDARGYAPVHLAVLVGDVAIVRALLDHGADACQLTAFKTATQLTPKALLQRREGRAYGHAPDSPERNQLLAEVQAIDALLDAQGSASTLDDVDQWLRGIGDASELAAKAGRPWRIAGA